MEAKGHDMPRVFAVLVQAVELIDDHLAKICTGHTFSETHGDVVYFEGVGHRHHAGEIECERLVVSAPVEQIGESELLEQPRRLKSLRQRRTQPPLEFLACRRSNRVYDVLEIFSLV